MEKTTKDYLHLEEMCASKDSHIMNLEKEIDAFRYSIHGAIYQPPGFPDRLQRIANRGFNDFTNTKLVSPRSFTTELNPHTSHIQPSSSPNQIDWNHHSSLT